MVGLYIEDTFFALSMGQWLPCPLAIWNFLMAILFNLVRSTVVRSTVVRRTVTKHLDRSQNWSDGPILH